MVYFKYLPNILKHSASMAVSMKILKTTQQMYSHWFLPVFKVVMMILVWRHYNYDNYKLKICALLISFQSGTATEKKKRKKESTFNRIEPNCLIITLVWRHQNFVYALQKHVSTSVSE